MTEEFNNGNVPEENTPQNPTEGNSIPEEQTEQASAANSTETPVPEQTVDENVANQEIPQQAPVSPTEPVSPRGQQTDFEQPMASPIANPVNPTAPTVATRKELIVLPIISFVVSVITLILAWFAPLPIIYVIIAFLGLIYGIVSLIVNIKRKKVLSIIALVLASLVFFASGAALFVRQPKDEQVKTEKTESSDEEDDSDTDVDDDSEDSRDIEDYIADSSEYKFKWTKSKFTNLKFSGYSDSGNSLKSIIKKFGKASDASISGNRLDLEYKTSDATSDERETIHLSFRRQDNGKFILSSGYASFPSQKVKIVSEKTYKSDWTQADVDALTVGDSGTGKGGANLNDIIKKHGNPTQARELIISNGGGSFTKSLKILYHSSDYSDTSKLNYVSLEFEKQSNDDYLLTYKYPKK